MKTEPNDQAFPIKDNDPPEYGLSKREWFAGMIAASAVLDDEYDIDTNVDCIVDLADALIAELNKKR